jgi:1-acyl-sn-glycerol-3-phosphate acyltransferase
MIFRTRKFYFKFKYPIFTKLYLWSAKVKVHNLTKRNFEQNEPVIYASNHKSFLDFCLISYFLRNPFTILIDKTIWNKKLIYRFLSWKARLIPVDKNNIVEQLKTINRVIKNINEKKSSLIIFPEGIHHHDKPVGKLKKGIIKIAKETGVKIIPISIFGIDNSFLGKKKLAWKDVYLKAGEPVVYDNFNKNENFLKSLESIITKLYLEVEEEVKSKK